MAESPKGKCAATASVMAAESETASLELGVEIARIEALSLEEVTEVIGQGCHGRGSGVVSMRASSSGLPTLK